mmetsp:Transcript_7163/g.8283  ORF Transcript_7163/g.8283 Transcript_7163/m.8283 type:complete len:642 (+) Transcript_7163:119-2044(+)
MPSSITADGTKNHCKSSTKNGMARFQRVQHTLTRKRFPILGRILDRLNAVPLYLRIVFLLLAVLWKFYIVYLLFKFLLGHNMSILSSRGIGFLRESPMAEGGANLTAGHHDSSNSISSGLVEIANSHRNKVISGHVDEEEGNNKREQRLLNYYNQDQSIKDGESSSYSHQQDRQLQAAISSNEGISNEEVSPIRVLHIVTALAEYNSGRRGTIEGQDRLQEVMIPILVDSVSSMISPPCNYEVDVYLVLGWKLKPERRRLIEDALPEGVGLEIWDDATPLGYDANESVTIQHVTRGLARQHRFVIKDKINHYDFFSVFEDDMRNTGGHISHFLEVTAELNRLKDAAPDTLPPEPRGDDLNENFYGPLSKLQLGRMIPGFIRVEVLLDESKYPSQKNLDPIPVDLEFDIKDEDGTIKKQQRTFDPIPCCGVSNVKGLPEHPARDQIMLWETSVFGANVRQLPTTNITSKSGMLDWVLLQTGPKTFHMSAEQFVGGYWAGRDGAYGNAPKLGEAHPRYIAQQGGWMATHEQLIDMHRNQCTQGFFPPFDKPAFNEDGLFFENVEFWSGAFQIFVGFGKGCNMQRVISMHPDHFSKHFLYHTANNKQASGQIKNERKVKAENFFGQVNSVVKAAKRKIDENKGE